MIIGAIINFLAVALIVYFVFVMPMNHFKERAAAKAGVTPADEEPKLPTEQELLVQIRDLLEKQRS
jgi:large conductance mechanosensitive channel